MNTQLNQNLKERIRKIAKHERVDPAELWLNLVLERFIVRLAHSKYADNFILKGGILLSHYIDLNRHTQDLDFLVNHVSSSVFELNKILDEIIAVPISDGFTFTDLHVSDLDHPHMKYPGARATMWGRFGKTRFQVKIDLGFGDLIEPIKAPFHLMKEGENALFESKVEIQCYPIEFIFAEKLETIFYRAGNNSRMKDFYDLYSLITSSNIKLHHIDQVINTVFTHRNTALDLPLIFNKEEIVVLQKYWTNYLRTLSDDQNTPTDFQQVVTQLNNWLSAHLLTTI